MKTKTADKPRYTYAARFIFLQFCALFGGLFLSKTVVFADVMPFGTALTAALPFPYAIMAGIGSLIGALSPANGGETIVYIAAVLLCLSINGCCPIHINSRKPLHSQRSAHQYPSR